MGTSDVTGGTSGAYFSSGLKPGSQEPVKRQTFQLGPYEITVLLTTDDKIISIEAVSVAKSFMSLEQRMNASTSHDVEQYFKEETASGSR